MDALQIFLSFYLKLSKSSSLLENRYLFLCVLLRISSDVCA